MQQLFRSDVADAGHCLDGSGIAGPAEKSNVVFRGMMQRMPEAVRQSFSAEQLGAMAEALALDSGRHAIKFQVSVPVLGRRYYVALFGGRERRSKERLTAEGQLGGARLAVIYVLGLWMFFSVLAGGLGGVLYLFKTTMGNDIGQAGLMVPTPFMHGGR